MNYTEEEMLFFALFWVGIGAGVTLLVEHIAFRLF